MQKEARPKVLLYQSIGFLAIIGLSWLDESLGLSSLIFKQVPSLPVFHASILEMLFVLMVWLLVTTSTRRVLERMKHLERFMRVCAWCRRIEYKGEWITLERFMEQGYDTPTSHGICKECLAVQKEAADRARRKYKEPPGQEERSPA